MERTEIEDLVRATKWYHGWEIVPGITTPGKSATDPKKALDRYGVPPDLRGIRALDIGAWDGPYSFELERRGAQVVSFDIQDPNATAYNVAHRILGSKNEYVRGSVYDLSAEKLGRFDLVLYLGVFYHLKHPMVAWMRIREVMNPHALLFFEGAILDFCWNVDKTFSRHKDAIINLRDLPITYYAAGEYASCWSNWYIPNKACLRDWLISAGFDDIQMDVKEQSSRVYGSAKLNPGADLKEHGISKANAEAEETEMQSEAPRVEE